MGHENIRQVFITFSAKAVYTTLQTLWASVGMQRYGFFCHVVTN
jgi:hypothetical protein